MKGKNQRLVVFILIASLSGLLISSLAPSFAETKFLKMRDVSRSGEIKGNVKCDNGNPLADAWVYIPGDSFSAFTDKDGNFILRFVPEGKYNLKITWETGEDLKTDIIVKAKTITDLGIVKVVCPIINVCAGKKDGIPCDDDDVCTISDVCTNGVCSGIPVSCDDNNPCTADECVPVVGCTNQPLNNVPCDDLNACTTNDICIKGLCIGTPLACNDWNHCTEDSCDPKTGCIFKPVNGIPCDDGNVCTGDDTCNNGKCSGVPVVCDDDNQCTSDKCDQIAGCIFENLTDTTCDDSDACTVNDRCVDGECTGEALNCDDKNECTLDECDPEIGCLHKPLSDTPCDDKNACTSDDTCHNGICSGTVINCDDNNPCTTDFCNVSSGCIYSPATGKPCDDSNACTTNDTCINGTCNGQIINCDDGDPCTDDFCDPIKGCIHTKKSGPGCTGQ